jgi:hypothetical protein
MCSKGQHPGIYYAQEVTIQYLRSLWCGNMQSKLFIEMTNNKWLWNIAVGFQLSLFKLLVMLIVVILAKAEWQLYASDPLTMSNSNADLFSLRCELKS